MGMGMGDSTMSGKIEEIPRVKLPHTPAAIGAAFDDPNLILSADLVPLVAFAEAAVLFDLVSAHVGARRTMAQTPTSRR